MVTLVRREPHPRFSQYRRYKSALREDFRFRCAYCDIHEAEWGGHRHFQVEHYRPRSLFPWLQAEYSNVLYSCDICNNLKGADWPEDDPSPGKRCYLDPCAYDLDDLFKVAEDGVVSGKVEAARYMIESLHLNRAYLRGLRVRRRREEGIHERFMLLFDEVEAQAAALPGDSPYARVLTKLIRQLTTLYRQHLTQLWDDRWKPPYELVE